jgi:hypothetical protein
VFTEQSGTPLPVAPPLCAASRLNRTRAHIWRIYGSARYEQRDGGVYLEIEGIALSRDIPTSMRWLLNPVVNHLSVNSLTTTLWQTREAVDRQEVAQKPVAAREHKGLN